MRMDEEDASRAPHHEREYVGGTLRAF
jgi:hypothetical protein